MLLLELLKSSIGANVNFYILHGFINRIIKFSKHVNRSEVDPDGDMNITTET